MSQLSKEEKVQYIKDLTKASSVANVCYDLKVQRTNISNGTARESDVDRVLSEMVKRIEETIKKYER